MPSRSVISASVTVGSETLEQSTSNSVDNGVTHQPSVPAAKAGNLTTRTSDTVGELTMATGHGITTGLILDIYWSGGKRYGVTVGTVSVNQVPFSLGSGDNLPADEFAITAMIPVVEIAAIPTATVKGIGAYSPVIGIVRFLKADDTVLKLADLAAGGKYTWVDGSGVTNPLAFDVAKVTFSHGQATAQTEMKALAAYN